MQGLTRNAVPIMCIELSMYQILFPIKFLVVSQLFLSHAIDVIYSVNRS